MELETILKFPNNTLFSIAKIAISCEEEKQIQEMNLIKFEGYGQKAYAIDKNNKIFLAIFNPYELSPDRELHLGITVKKTEIISIDDKPVYLENQTRTDYIGTNTTKLIFPSQTEIMTFLKRLEFKFEPYHKLWSPSETPKYKNPFLAFF